MFNDDEDYFNKYEKLPLFLKGKEILDVVTDILALIQDEEEHLEIIKQIILEDAYMLTAKIANAEGGDLYDLRMENAAIIRKAACDLMIQNHSLEMFGFEHVEYYSIVRKLIEEYRLLFIDWVAGFDKSNYIVDRWGLFNPPGIGPFDEDSSDDQY
jgi:hypothetical protein